MPGVTASRNVRKAASRAAALDVGDGRRRRHVERVRVQLGHHEIGSERQLHPSSDLLPRHARDSRPTPTPIRCCADPGAGGGQWGGGSTVVGRSTSAISFFGASVHEAVGHHLADLVPVGVVEHHAQSIATPPEHEERMTGAAQHLQLLARRPEREHHHRVGICPPRRRARGRTCACEPSTVYQPMPAPRRRRAVRGTSGAAGSRPRPARRRCNAARLRPSLENTSARQGAVSRHPTSATSSPEVEGSSTAQVARVVERG